MTAINNYSGQPGTVAGVLFTAGANGAAVRGIRAINTEAAGGGAHSVRLGIGGVTDAALLLPPWDIDANGMEEDDGLILLEAGQTINGQADANAIVTVHIFGMDL